MTRFGCFAAQDVRALYSLANGRLQFTYTEPIAAFGVPRSGGTVRLIGVHSAHSATGTLPFGEDAEALAIVTYAPATAPLQRVPVRIKPPVEYPEVMQEGLPLLLADGAAAAVPGLSLPAAADGAIGGLGLQLGFAGQTLAIPIRDDAPDPAGAALPPGFFLSALPVESVVAPPAAAAVRR